MRRSFWILVTYITRPMIWLISVALIAGGIFLYNTTTDEYQAVDIGVLNSSTPVRTTEQLEQTFMRPKAEVEIDWGALAHQQLGFVLPRSGNRPRHIGEAEHKIVNQRLNELTLPENVVAIHTRSWGVGQDVVDRLGEITSLKRLGFLVAYGVDPVDLSPLANLKQLHVLDLGIVSSEETSLEPLMELPALNTLSLGSHQWVNQKRMAEVARLPALEILYLPDVSENQQAMAALGELEHAASLKQIRIAIPMDTPQKLASVQAVIPSIDVGSSLVYPPRLYALIYAVWASMIAGSLGLHVVGQFSMPLAQLAPGYRAAHQRVFWAIMATIIGGLTVVVSVYGANWLAVASVVGLCTVAGAGDSIIAQQTFGQSQGMRRWLSFVATLLFFTLIGLAFLRPTLAEEYLMRDSVVLPLLLIAITTTIIYRASKVMNQLCRSGIESARPLMLSFHDIQRASIDLRTRKLTADAEDLEAAAEPYARQGQLAIVFGYIALALVAVSTLVPDPLYGVGVQHYIAMLCVFLSCWSLMIVGVKWWQRMPYLAGMMTRPPRRDRQISELFKGVRDDVLRLWPVALANLLLISGATLFSPDNVAIRVVISGLFVASITVVCYATILWALTIRRVWGIAIMSFVVYAGIAALAAVVGVLGLTAAEMAASALPIGRVMVATGMIAIVGAAATIWARRYFVRMEWGQFV